MRENLYLLYSKQTLHKGVSSLTPLCKACFFFWWLSLEAYQCEFFSGVLLILFPQKNAVGKKMNVWNIIQPPERDKIYKIWAGKEMVDISLDTRPLSILAPAGLSTWWPTILAPFCVREILPGAGLDSHLFSPGQPRLTRSQRLWTHNLDLFPLQQLPGMFDFSDSFPLCLLLFA